MSSKICQFNFDSVKAMTDDEGHLNIILTAAPESKYAVKTALADMKNVLGSSGKLTALIQKAFNKRTLNQNAMMWELCEKIALVHNGGRTGGVTAWDVYTDAIERFGGKYEYVECLKRAEPMLREHFRAVKYIKPFDEEKDLHIYKCFYGSSKFTTAEMKQLIDGLLDEASALGIETDKYSI